MHGYYSATQRCSEIRTIAQNAQRSHVAESTVGPAAKMSALAHGDLIDASELDSLLQRLTTAQNDKERLRHLKTAARNYTFDGGQIARLLAPMAASPAAAVEAAVMLLRRAPLILREHPPQQHDLIPSRGPAVREVLRDDELKAVLGAVLALVLDRQLGQVVNLCTYMCIHVHVHVHGHGHVHAQIL